MVGHDRTLLGKPLDVLGLFLQKTHRYKQREISILMPRVLEHPIERFLHVFPEGIPPRLDHHATANRAVFG